MLLRGLSNSRDAYRHLILHKKFVGEGLIHDLARQGATPSIDSLSHKDYFEKYLAEGEAFDNLTTAIRVICENEKPEFIVKVIPVTIPYLTGVNAWCQNHVNDNMNQIILLFEQFPPAGTRTADGGATMTRRGGGGDSVNGHFMLLWRFPRSFNKKEETERKFCLFDPFGRNRKDDPEEYYYQKAKRFDYQFPDSNTCALWCIFALLQFCLQIARVQDIHPVHYSGDPGAFNNPDFVDAHRREWIGNEHSLYTHLIRNYRIFQPTQLHGRAMFNE